MNAASLVDALKSRGVIPADAPAPRAESDRPWFIALLMGLAGWCAGLFALVFAALFFDLGTRSAMHGFLIIGCVALAVAFVLYLVLGGRLFIEQLALSLSIAGQLAIAAFLTEKFQTAAPIAAVLLGLQLVVFVAMRDRVARALAAFFASIAWVFVVRYLLRPHESENIFFDSSREFALPLFGAWTVPLAWLLTWLPIIGLLAWLRHTERRWMMRTTAEFARPAIAGLLLGLTFGGMGAEPVSMLALGTEMLGRGVDGWALFPVLSIALAMFAAYVAFQLRSAGLLGLAIFAALAHLARFYYLFGATLMDKSLIMLIVGAVTLIVAAWLARRAEAA
ncbi:MAG TPA: DUF4401 domain-containing protein [Steroidobacteraceae bacterium]|nr:DUF4401 domain-containing protein [Steroidobacteraceae bacterium]